MDGTTLAGLLWSAGLLGTILVGVLTNALWDWTKEHISFASSKWPKIRGQWAIIHEDGSRLNESVTIQQQFGPKFRGELRTPDPANSSRLIIQIVRGQLLDRSHALFTAQQKDNDCTEITTGLLALHPGMLSASGKSVFFGATSPTDSVASFKMQKID